MDLYNSLEGFLTSVGLHEPLSRGIVFAGLVALPVMFLKPSMSYFETNDGFKLSKKWSLFATENDDPNTLTLVPWYLWPVIGLIIGALIL